MAKVKFKAGQPIQKLSGQYGNELFKTYKDGSTTLFIKGEWTHGAGAKEREKRIVDHCTGVIQLSMADVVVAIEDRKLIRLQVKKIYAKCASHYEDDEELAAAILHAYYNKRRALPRRRKRGRTGSLWDETRT